MKHASQIVKFLNLAAAEKCTVRQMASELGVCDRTVYRFIIGMEEAGFIIDSKIPSGKLFINKDNVPPFVKILATK
jgi:predicted transcriptional regulator